MLGPNDVSPLPIPTYSIVSLPPCDLQMNQRTSYRKKIFMSQSALGVLAEIDPVTVRTIKIVLQQATHWYLPVLSQILLLFSGKIICFRHD